MRPGANLVRDTGTAVPVGLKGRGIGLYLVISRNASTGVFSPDPLRAVVLSGLQIGLASLSVIARTSRWPRSRVWLGDWPFLLCFR